MATQFVPCRDLDHVVECFRAGLLWMNRAPKTVTPSWWHTQHAELTHMDERMLIRRYSMKTIWLPTDFALLVED